MPDNESQCAVCGNPITAIQKFCSNCGNQLSEIRRPIPPVKKTNKNYPYAELIQASEIQKERPSQKANESTYWIVSGLLIGVLLIICVVLLFVAPGVGIGAIAITLPALVRTSLVVYARRKRGFQTTSGRTVFLFLTSTSVAVLFALLTGILGAIMIVLAGIIALFSLCLSGGSDKTAEGVFLSTLLLAAPIFLAIASVFVMWSYSRWKREISQPDKQN